MLARAAMNDPWIFRSIKRYLADGTLLSPPSPEERLAVMFGHLAESVRIKGERYGVMEFRKYISGYLRNLPGVSKLRAELVVLNSQQELIDRVNVYMENLHITEPQLAA
jgi:tRNA-dihydrouridine synthase